MTWSEMRKKLEQEYLADCLCGKIQYFVTRYRESHDAAGRASILMDGKEILQGNHWNVECPTYPICYDRYGPLNDKKLDAGAFDEGDFYGAFQEFDNQSIEESLQSKDLLVRIFAVLDRRVGKRRLLKMRDTIQDEPMNFQTFYAIRMEAEGLLNDKTISSEECLI